jgi:hypothetical protein
MLAERWTTGHCQRTVLCLSLNCFSLVYDDQDLLFSLAGLSFLEQRVGKDVLFDLAKRLHTCDLSEEN